MSTDRIKTAVVQCKLTEGLPPLHESHHPGQAQRLPAPSVEAADGNGDSQLPIPLEAGDIRSSLSGRKVEQSACFPYFVTNFKSNR